MQAPCKDCQDRKLGCHSSCEKYIEYTKLVAEISRKRTELNRFIGDFIYIKEKAKRKRR